MNTSGLKKALDVLDQLQVTGVSNCIKISFVAQEIQKTISEIEHNTQQPKMAEGNVK